MKNNKLSLDMFLIIEDMETMEFNSLEKVKGGVTSCPDCTCGSGNNNSGGGSCSCGGANSNHRSCAHELSFA